MNKCAVVDGIIAVANHKLRFEGIESYKEYLSEEYVSKEKIKKVLEEELCACHEGVCVCSDEYKKICKQLFGDKE